MMWKTYSRPMSSTVGNSPPKIRYASHGPMNGMAMTTESVIRSPVPESRSSGRE